MSHITAARFWMAYGSPGFPHVGEATFGAQPADAVDSGFRTKNVIGRITVLGLLGSGEAAHLLSIGQAARRYSKRIVAHSCNIPLPQGAILPVSSTLEVCSPALTFVQMGTVLPQSLHAFFGMQLCGIHALAPGGGDPAAQRFPDADETAMEDLPKRTAIMTVCKLRSFIEMMPGLTGRKNAERALRLVGERSRSPMESVAYLLLCSPQRIGGFGLPRPRLNCRIELPTWLHEGDSGKRGSSGRRVQVGRKARPYAEADMLFVYGGRTVAVDYHGRVPHEGEGNLHHDALRSNAFQDLKIPRYTLTSRQLFNDALLEKAANQIAGSLGWRSRTCLEDVRLRRVKLRRELLGGVLEEWWGIR